MNGYLIYNTRTQILSSIDISFEIQCEELIEFKQDVCFIEFNEIATKNYDYHELMGIVLSNSSYSNALKENVNVTLSDDEFVGIVEIGNNTNNKIYITDGKIWNWNFEFIVTDI